MYSSVPSENVSDAGRIPSELLACSVYKVGIQLQPLLLCRSFSCISFRSICLILIDHVRYQLPGGPLGSYSKVTLHLVVCSLHVHPDSCSLEMCVTSPTIPAFVPLAYRALEPYANIRWSPLFRMHRIHIGSGAVAALYSCSCLSRLTVRLGSETLSGISLLVCVPLIYRQRLHRLNNLFFRPVFFVLSSVVVVVCVVIVSFFSCLVLLFSSSLF